MGILTRDQIVQKIKKGEMGFEPGLDKFQLQVHSVDLRLGFTFMVPKSWIMRPEGRVALNVHYGENRKNFDVVELEEGQYFEILPGEFVAVTTLERVKIPAGIMAILYPRSSVNRRGLSVDLSGVIDAGYEGQLLVPVRNNTISQVIRLYPGERFCQLVFEELNDMTKKTSGRYQKKDVVVGVLREKSTREESLIKKGKIKELKKLFQLG